MNSKRIMDTVKTVFVSLISFVCVSVCTWHKMVKHLSLEAALSLRLFPLLNCHQVTQLLLKYPHGLFLPLYYLDFSICKQWKLILATVIRGIYWRRSIKAAPGICGRNRGSQQGLQLQSPGANNYTSFLLPPRSAPRKECLGDLASDAHLFSLTGENGVPWLTRWYLMEKG